jgi:hypothetical protein
MSVEAGVERLAALVLILTCVSHIAAPAAWQRLFAAIRAQGEAAGLYIAALHLPLGLMIAAFHWVWSWPGMWVTIIGWALLAKGTAHLVMPSLSRHSLDLVEGEQGASRIRFGGLLMLPLALTTGLVALHGTA